jgi:cytoskeletal protein CcmA (bactofilin family)
MAIFTASPRKDEFGAKPEPKGETPREAGGSTSPSPGPARHMEEPRIMSASAKPSESVLAAGITIEGKIEGNGNVRVSGRFKGNINVKGEFTIESGASIDGEVTADTVLVGGEVRGKIVASSQVEFKESGTLIGDVKAGTLAVAAGSKMRGNVEFGWKDGEIGEADLLTGSHALKR